jgi:hypothetical protein
VSGDKINKQAGGHIVDGSNIKAGRDVSLAGTVESKHPEGSSKSILASGLLILCVATGVMGLVALGGVLMGKIGSDAGTKIIGILWGSSLLTGVARAVARK